MTAEKFQDHQKLFDNLRVLINHKEASDVIFLLSGTNSTTEVEIYAHKALLAARSPVFRAMFFGLADLREKNEKYVRIPNIGKDAFLQMLEYIYTGTQILYTC